MKVIESKSAESEATQEKLRLDVPTSFTRATPLESSVEIVPVRPLSENTLLGVSYVIVARTQLSLSEL